jgi:excisionase family DNA binding protein
MSRWSSEERVPFAPLAALLGDDEVLRRRLKMTPARLARAREIGLSVWTADRLAVGAGFHPVHVWGDEWEIAVDAEIAADISVRPLPLASDVRGVTRPAGRRDKRTDRGRLCFSVPQVAAALRISESACYARVRRGEIPAVRIGRTVHIPRNWLELHV